MEWIDMDQDRDWGSPLMNRYWNFWFHKMLQTLWGASQERVSFMDLLLMYCMPMTVFNTLLALIALWNRFQGSNMSEPLLNILYVNRACNRWHDVHHTFTSAIYKLTYAIQRRQCHSWYIYAVPAPTNLICKFSPAKLITQYLSIS
jgi:hypothetical protein